MLEQRIQQQFFDSADLKYQAAEALTRPIADAVQAVLGCITSGGKVLVCGSGPAALTAQYFVAQFIGRFERDRPSLPALALSGDAMMLGGVGDDADLTQVFAKQVQALGNPGDVLIVLAPQGSAAAVLAAVDEAHAKEMAVVALTGNGGGLLGAQLIETDVHICVPHDRAVRVHEVHSLALHCICDAVDLQLLGEQDNT